MTAAAPNSRILDAIRGHFNPTPPDKRHHREDDQYDKGMLGAIDFVESAIRWAWQIAWEPAAGDRPGAKTAEEETNTEIRVPGAKHALGVGNHQAQQALRDAGNALAGCDAILDVACQVASRGEGKRQLPVVHSCTTAHVAELTAITTSIRWRLNYIADRATTFTHQTATAVIAQVEHADTKISTARRALETAMRAHDRNNPTAVDPDRLCKNCTIRPRLKDRTRCSTCHTYKQRNGVERPAELDAA